MELNLTELAVGLGVSIVSGVATARAHLASHNRRINALARANRNLPRDYVPRSEAVVRFDGIERLLHFMYTAQRGKPDDPGLSIRAIEAAADAAAGGDWIDQYVLLNATFERIVPWMYLDTEGHVTVGSGNMLPDVESAELLPFLKPDGTHANHDEIAADFNRVRAMKPGELWTHYHCASSLTLAADRIAALTRQRCTVFTAELRRAFPSFDAYPTPARMPLLDMIYNMGLGYIGSEHGLLSFHHLVASVASRDWAAASRQCNRPEVPATRNAWTASMFLHAAASQEAA